MDNPKPQFNIGDIVFFLKDGKAVSRMVIGVDTDFNVSGDHYPNGKTLSFKGYEYNVGNASDSIAHLRPERWISSADVYKSKEELIESL